MAACSASDLDGAGALAEEVEQLEPLRGRDGLADPGELLIDVVLELSS